MKNNEESHLNELCVITAGSVDSGKSSLIGVLTTGELDNGNGSARSKIAKHPHEITVGRTSDISTNLVKINDKNIMLVDLCGHRKYLKTTLFGMVGFYPDYAILVVEGSRGIIDMTREHLGIMLYVKIPFIIVITRVDLTPEDSYKQTMKSLKVILKRFNKTCIQINSWDEIKLKSDELRAKEGDSIKIINECANQMKDNPNIVPVITVSNKTGFYIEPLKILLSSLKPRLTWYNPTPNGSLFFIDGRFSPPGIGLVVSGIVKGRNIKKGDYMILGPYGKEFIQVQAWSLHNNDAEPVNELIDKQHGCIAFRIKDKKFKDFSKNDIRKGMLLMTENLSSNICYQFKANVQILNHSTTIGKKYSPVIHCGTVRQTARIIMDEDKQLKIGDNEEVGFRFIKNPEYLEPNMTFFFREGTTRGIGYITSILSLSSDPNKEPFTIQKVKKVYNSRHKYRNISIL